MKITPKMTFEEYIQTQKCPFRVNSNTNELMPCDYDCVALIINEDNSYNCLRLVNINYAIDQKYIGLLVPRAIIEEEDE